MSFWSSIAYKLKEILRTMIGAKTIEQALQVNPVISSQMENAIQLWCDMYKNQSPWLNEPTFERPTRVVSLGLAASIASEKARTALLEMASEITAPTKEVEIANPKYQKPEPDEFGNVLPTAEPEMVVEERPVGSIERAKYLESQYKKLKSQLRKQIEYGIAKGGLVIKPYVVISADENDPELKTVYTIEFDYIQADCFYPLAFDASGNITEAAFIQTKAEKDVIYRRLEYHKWEKNRVQVINRAYKSTNTVNNDMLSVDLGEEIALTEVPEWQNIPQSTVIKNVKKPLFAYFKMPEANTVDTFSPLGVSGFSRAVNLIKDADLQYSRLLWEYEAGEKAVNIDRDAFKFINDPQGQEHTVLGTMQERLYRRMDITSEELFEPYAPQLRDNNYIAGLNAILMRIEDVCAISRGTLSDSADIARTATELKILKQRSYQANLEIQQAIELTLKDVVYIMDVYCTLYQITPEGEYDVSFEWDDSLIVDTYEELTTRLSLMNEGLVSKLENRMWYFGETERQAQEALTKIEQENLQSMEHDLMMQASAFGLGQNEFNKAEQQINQNAKSREISNRKPTPSLKKVSENE